MCGTSVERLFAFCNLAELISYLHENALIQVAVGDGHEGEHRLVSRAIAPIGSSCDAVSADQRVEIAKLVWDDVFFDVESTQQEGAAP